MKIAIQSSDTQMSKQIVTHLIKLCQQQSIMIDTNNPNIIVSIGGDGTLLTAFHQYQHLLDTVHFVAIHTGHLGFYTDFLIEEIDELVSLLTKDITTTYSYPILSVELTNDTLTNRFYALNECVLKTLSGTLVCEVYIKNHLFEVFRGDGLCIATPTGSTGISKSLGGAVLHPHVDAMQLVEIAPLNNRVYRTIHSPLILPKTDNVTLKIKMAKKPYISIDNLEPIFLNDEDNNEITIQLDNKRIRFADQKKVDFWSRVESSFIGDNQKYE